MADVRQKLGTPSPTDPITGIKKPFVPARRRVRDRADQNGWTFRYSSGDYHFIKGDQILDVYFDWWDGKYVANATFFRGDDGRGIPIPCPHNNLDRIFDVLDGVECSCPPFTQIGWEQGNNPGFDPDCPIHAGCKQEPRWVSRRAWVEAGFADEVGA